LKKLGQKMALFYFLLNAWIARSLVEIEVAEYQECVDTKSNCEPSTWQKCIKQDDYYNACCMTCHTASILSPEAESCYSQGWSDPMTPLECAQAAMRSGDQYRELEARYRNSNPLGCFVGENGEYFYWNDGLNSDYEAQYYGLSRVCLNSERPSENIELRVYTPNTLQGMGRQEIPNLPEMEDDQWRWIEDETTCDDAVCGGLADQENCLKVADDINLPYTTESDIHLPYGCFFIDGELVWNSGNGIRNPPRFDQVYYSHVCMDCKPDRCALPVWAWLTIVLCILIVLLVFMALCCYQCRNGGMSNFGTNRGFASPANPGLQASPANNIENQSLVPGGRRSTDGPPAGAGFNFPLRGSNSWDMAVPMNLFNRQDGR